MCGKCNCLLWRPSTRASRASTPSPGWKTRSGRRRRFGTSCKGCSFRSCPCNGRRRLFRRSLPLSELLRHEINRAVELALGQSPNIWNHDSYEKNQFLTDRNKKFLANYRFFCLKISFKRIDPPFTGVRIDQALIQSTHLEINVQHGLPVALAVDAGVVHDDVDAAEGVHAKVEGLLHAVGRRDVDPPIRHVIFAVSSPQILGSFFSYLPCVQRVKA